MPVDGIGSFTIPASICFRNLPLVLTPQASKPARTLCTPPWPGPEKIHRRQCRSSSAVLALCVAAFISPISP